MRYGACAILYQELQWHLKRLSNHFRHRSPGRIYPQSPGPKAQDLFSVRQAIQRFQNLLLTARIASFVAIIRSPYRRIRRQRNSPHLFLSILHHAFQYSFILSYLEHLFLPIMFTIVDTAIGALLLHQATTTLLFNNGSILGASGLLRTFISTRSLTIVLFFAGMALSYVLMNCLAPEVLPEYPIVRWHKDTLLFTLVTSTLIGWGTTVRQQTPIIPRSPINYLPGLRRLHIRTYAMRPTTPLLALPSSNSYILHNSSSNIQPPEAVPRNIRLSLKYTLLPYRTFSRPQVKASIPPPLPQRPCTRNDAAHPLILHLHLNRQARNLPLRRLHIRSRPNSFWHGLTRQSLRLLRLLLLPA